MGLDMFEDEVDYDGYMAWMNGDEIKEPKKFERQRT
jgi:hypothetical protein